MPTELLTLWMKLPVFALVAARLGGLIMFQPLLGAMSVPVRLRAIFIVALAALVTPLIAAPATLPDSPAGVILAMAAELLLGALIGLVLSVCFMGLQLAGLLIEQESGLLFGQIADPTTGEDAGMLGMLYLQLGVVVYLIIGGHRMLLLGCLDLFQNVPLLSDSGLFTDGVDLLASSLTSACSIAICIAGPALITLFLVNLALGFISRTVPQLNVVMLGFSLKSMLGFVLVTVSLPSAMNAFIELLDELVQWTGELTSG